MSDMIERVAKAIRFAENPLDGDPIGVMIHNYDFLQADGIEAQTALVDEVCRVIARAAIEAMREPTEEMVDAATSARGGRQTVAEASVATWQAMIDAALNPHAEEK